MGPRGGMEEDAWTSNGGFLPISARHFDMAGGGSPHSAAACLPAGSFRDEASFRVDQGSSRRVRAPS